VLLLGVFVAFFTPERPLNDALFRTVKTGGLTAAGVAVAAFAVIAALSWRPGIIEQVLQRVSRVLPARFGARLSHMAHMFMHGLAVARHPLRLAEALAWSVPLWLAICASIWFVTMAFHMTIPFTGSFLVVALLVVGVAVPTPGAVGGFHEAFRIAATAFFGVDNDRAVGAAIVLHASTFLPITLLGALFMLQDGLGFGSVRRLGDEARHAEEAADVEPAVSDGEVGRR
jgi:glycosyltransferase 2 family protein